MQEPLITVIVPVYKVEDYLDDCIQSIVNQTYRNLEILLVDDGSPDNSPQICDDWAQKDSRIKVIHKKNAGVAAARNTGVELATGEYIGFVDSDDYIAENMYEELLNSLLASGKKMSNCTAYRVAPESNVLLPMVDSLKSKIYDTQEAINTLLSGMIDTAVWSKLFERNIFEGIRFPEGETNEEFPVLLPLINNADGIADTGKFLYYYRMREGSITASSFMKETQSGLVHKNLEIIKSQIKELDLHCEKAYRLFAVNCAFFCSLSMEKHYKQLSDKIKKDYSVYRKICKKYFFDFIFSNRVKVKNKILCFLVLTKLLRPIYKAFYKEHL